MWEAHGFGYGHGFMWLIWIVIIIAVIFLIRAGSGGNKYSNSSEDALEILKKRFARGEIDEEEYQRKRKVIGE